MAHGNSKKVTWDELRQFDIILTTYGTLSAEYTRILKFEEDCKEKGIVYPDAKQMAIDFPFLGPRSRFYRVILDEAQCIKNKTTKAAGAAYRLKALTRVCLTGTPMMNGIIELYSLIKFLRIRPYNSWPSFSRVCIDICIIQKRTILLTTIGIRLSFEGGPPLGKTY